MQNKIETSETIIQGRKASKAIMLGRKDLSSVLLRGLT
jgi:hypothetical protein